MSLLLMAGVDKIMSGIAGGIVLAVLIVALAGGLNGVSRAWEKYWTLRKEKTKKKKKEKQEKEKESETEKGEEKR